MIEAKPHLLIFVTERRSVVLLNEYVRYTDALAYIGDLSEVKNTGTARAYSALRSGFHILVMYVYQALCTELFYVSAKILTCVFNPICIEYNSNIGKLFDEEIENARSADIVKIKSVIVIRELHARIGYALYGIT